MQEAFGGVLNIVLIAVFFVIVEGILGMTVNYSKAFRMKNYVISTIEQYEASSTCFTNGDSACLKRIKLRAEQLGYSPTDLKCSNGQAQVQGLFCYNEVRDSSNKNSAKYKTYRIDTQVDFNFPIINRMGFSIFQVGGDTRLIKVNS